MEKQYWLSALNLFVLRVEARISNAVFHFVKDTPSHLPDLLIKQTLGPTDHCGTDLTMTLIRENFYVRAPQQLTKKGIRGCDKYIKMRGQTVELV